MRHMMIALFFVATPALAQDSGAATTTTEAAPAEKTAAQHMLENLRAEGMALESLAASIKDEVKAGRVKVTPEAMAKFEEGKARWQETKALAEAGNTKAAYEMMRSVRQSFGEFLKAGVSGKPAKSVKAGFQALWGIYDARVTHIVGWAKENTPNDEAKQHLLEGQELWQAAKSAAESGKYIDAWTKMLQGVERLDHVMWDTWQGK